MNDCASTKPAATRDHKGSQACVLSNLCHRARSATVPLVQSLRKSMEQAPSSCGTETSPVAQCATSAARASIRSLVGPPEWLNFAHEHRDEHPSGRSSTPSAAPLAGDGEDVALALHFR